MRLGIIHARLAQSFLAELVCSFIFGYTVYSSVLNTKFEKHPINPISVNLAIAFCGVAIIYTFCDLTISHFNPAITLAAILTLKLNPINGIGFIIAQFLGFILAAIMVEVNFPGDWYQVMQSLHVNRGSEGVTDVNLFFSEFTLTAILVFVAFSVGVNARRNPYVSLYEDEELPNRTIVAPLTIGLTLGFLSFLAAKVSGGSFNPGLVFAPMILNMKWLFAWQYFVAEFAGGLFGALLQVWLLYK